MTDYSFESQSDDAKSGFEDRFAFARRMVDLSHPIESEPEEPESILDNLPAHPEIVELIESILVANPSVLPAGEAPECQREHAVFIPEHYEAGYAYPLIVWFHGDGSSEAELAEVMPAISDRNYIGVALRGSLKSASGYAWSASDADTMTLQNDVRAIVTSLRRQYHIHSERIFLAGFGSGATTAIQLMLNKPEWFGGVISFSGQLPVPDAPLEHAEELRDKRILLATSLGSTTTRVGDVVAAGRILYSAGMQVGTRVYQDVKSTPTGKMLRDLDLWLMDGICEHVSA